jgi:hypothetical protein
VRYNTSLDSQGRFTGPNSRSALRIVNVVNGANVEMIKSCGRACFALEAFQSLRVRGNAVGQELQGNVANCANSRNSRCLPPVGLTCFAITTL